MNTKKFMENKLKKRKKKKFTKRLVELVDRLFLWLEKKDIIDRTPAFISAYDDLYPEVRKIEENYEVIRKECLALLEGKDDLMDVKNMASDHTKGGIHKAKWKSFMIKSGFMVKNSRKLCPKTYDAIESIPGVTSAFFSILDPNQYIKAHRGYYQGIMRYHLGVVIPANNESNKCWLRINDDISDNKNYDKKSIEKGEKYHWKNGKSIIFNDNYLHDAANESDEVRVILWLDLKRKLPHFLGTLNTVLLKIAHITPAITKIRNRAEKHALELFNRRLQEVSVES